MVQLGLGLALHLRNQECLEALGEGEPEGRVGIPVPRTCELCPRDPPEGFWLHLHDGRQFLGRSMRSPPNCLQPQVDVWWVLGNSLQINSKAHKTAMKT